MQPTIGPASFDDPDQVSIVIHNHRWRLSLAEGEPKYDDLERRLAHSPVVAVPTITLEVDANGAPHPEPGAYAKMFSGKYEHRTIAASATICPKRRRRPSPRPLLTSMLAEPRMGQLSWLYFYAAGMRHNVNRQTPQSRAAVLAVFGAPTSHSCEKRYRAKCERAPDTTRAPPPYAPRPPI